MALATALRAVFVAALLLQGARGQAACVNSTSSGACACTASGDVSTVDCTGLQLSGLPTQIPSATNSLVLATNAITQLSAQAFNGLTDLQKLSLLSNDLTTLPSGVFAGLSALTTLILSGNPIVTLPSTLFAPLDGVLQYLYLDQCQLSVIPSGVFSGLTHLLELHLSGNALTLIDSTAFAALTALQVIVLSSNSLTSIAASAFSANQALLTLDLRSNTLSQLPNGLFSPLTLLTELDLQYNSLTGVQVLSTGGLGALQTLTLDNNAVTFLPASSLSSLTALTYLSLNNNELTTLASTVFAAQPSLSQLYLGGNPWDCCGLEWLRAVTAVEDGSAFLCTRPELFAGQSLFASQANITVCTTDAPTTPVAPNVSQVTPFAVELSWPPSAGNAFAVDYYQVQYVASDSNAAWTTFTCAGGQLPVRLDGGSMALATCEVLSTDYYGNAINPLSVTLAPPLLPFANYTFRVLAHSPLNGGTLSAAGASSAVTRTLTYTPSQPPQPTLTANATAVTVVINPPVPANGIITEYVVQMWSATGQLLGQQNTSLTEATFSALTPYTVYAFTVQAFTSAGGSLASPSISIATSQAAPSVAPAVAAANVTSQSIAINWTAIVLPQANGIITYYTVAVAFPNGTTARANVSGSLQYHIAGLSPATSYGFTVSASTVGGTSSASTLLTITTLAAAPSQPLAPTVSPVSGNATCLLVVWAVPPQPNGEIVLYQLYQWYNATAAVVHNYSGSVLSTDICGLAPAAQYSFSVKAYTALGGSQLSAVATGQTADAPANPTQVSSYTATPTSLNLTWSAPSPYVGAIVGYYVYLVRTTRDLLYYTPFEDDTETLLYSGPDTWFLQEDLQPATTYYHAVYAVTSAGSTNISIVTSGITATDLPTRPGAPEITVVNSASVVLAWTQPLTPNGNLTEYAIFDENSGATLATVSGGTTQTTLSQLSSSTTYVLAVAAYTSAGMGELSRATLLTTGSSAASYTQTIVIVVVVAFVSILSIGFLIEKSRSSVSRQKTAEGDLGATMEPGNDSATTSNDIREHSDDDAPRILPSSSHHSVVAFAPTVAAPAPTTAEPATASPAVPSSSEPSPARVPASASAISLQNLQKSPSTTSVASRTSSNASPSRRPANFSQFLRGSHSSSVAPAPPLRIFEESDTAV